MRNAAKGGIPTRRYILVITFSRNTGRYSRSSLGRTCDRPRRPRCNTLCHSCWRGAPRKLCIYSPGRHM